MIDMETNEVRELILKEVLELKKPNCLLEIATGVGKSRLAIEKIRGLYDKDKRQTLLIVVPRNIHKKNWADEIDKWWEDCPLDITYTTYASFPKYAGEWDFIIWDEVHHLSERCREAISNFAFKNTVLLSATVGRELKQSLKYLFHDIDFYSVGLRDAIDEGVLPDPKVFLIPLTLENNIPTESIWKNKSAKGRLIECSYADRWKFIRQKVYPVRIYCTERQYMNDLDSQIEWWKRNYMRTRNQGVKNKWLMLCTERLKWLATKKNPVISGLLISVLKNKRTLTFCNSIEQTEILGKHCINSKNKEAIKAYEDFNEGKIKHITACNMLNESMNIKDCQIGIYANLNSSETIIKQRAGRLLRHKNPVIIIPYFVNTREQELVEKMLENYNKELITVVNDINEMKLT